MRRFRFSLFALAMMALLMLAAGDAAALKCTYMEQGWMNYCNKACDYDALRGGWGCWNDWPDRCCTTYEGSTTCGEGSLDMCPECDPGCGSPGL